MHELLEFARGPLFLATFSFMVLGLLRHVVLRSLGLYRVLRRTPKKDVPWGKVAKTTAGWLVPVKHIMTGAPTMKIAAILFHVGLILVPVFLASHVYLWNRGTGVVLPSLGSAFGDYLTLMTIITGGYLMFYRTVNRTARSLSGRVDYLVLFLVWVPFVSGWFASHPESSPLAYQTMMLVHILSAELVFILMPTTKLAHVVLYPFDRVSPEIFWRLVPGAGERVAQTLRGSPEGAEV